MGRQQLYACDCSEPYWDSRQGLTTGQTTWVPLSFPLLTGKLTVLIAVRSARLDEDRAGENEMKRSSL
jgi:hypothetical protein